MPGAFALPSHLKAQWMLGAQQLKARTSSRDTCQGPFASGYTCHWLHLVACHTLFQQPTHKLCLYFRPCVHNFFTPPQHSNSRIVQNPLFASVCNMDLYLHAQLMRRIAGIGIDLIRICSTGKSLAENDHCNPCLNHQHLLPKPATLIRWSI